MSLNRLIQHRDFLPILLSFILLHLPSFIKALESNSESCQLPKSRHIVRLDAPNNTILNPWSVPWEESVFYIRPTKNVSQLTTFSNVYCHLQQPSSNNHHNQPLQHTGRFVLQFECLERSARKCSKAKHAFESAVARLETALSLKEDIVIRAKYMNFCQHMPDAYGPSGECKYNHVLGSSFPSAYFAGNHLHPDFAQATNANLNTNRNNNNNNNQYLTHTFLYPQALVKQFSRAEDVPFRDHDILANFNSQYQFWFEDDDRPIAPHEYDFTTILLHELLHGAGLVSGWRNWLSQLTTDGSSFTDLVLPFIRVDEDIYISGFDHPFIYDAFLQTDNGVSLLEYHDRIAEFNVKARPEAFARRFKSSTNFLVAQELSEKIKKEAPSVVFRIPSYAFQKTGIQSIDSRPPVIPLYTAPGRYEPNSAISHFDTNTFTGQPDFLMRHFAENGVTLKDLEAKYSRGWKYGAIGPYLTMVMRSMGYLTKNDVDMNLVTDRGVFLFADYAARVFNADSESASRKSVGVEGGVVILSVVLSILVHILL